MEWTVAVQKLWDKLSEHRPSLYPAEEWDDLLDIRIAKLPMQGMDSQQTVYASSVKAGLHLLNESLDKSHELSQEIHNPTGSYWHGIMHRMEGDYSNAKYWFRQVGAHTAFAAVLEQAKYLYHQFEADSIQSATLKGQLAKLMAGSEWDPYLFIDVVQQQVNVAQEEQAEGLLLEIQWIEMKQLLQYSMEQTGGKRIEL
ncbi:hypothetical protein GC093_32740 [Paenibacillus sp. LMG 31456]|uniref:Uncharacterized protein n=1 Tax=Paenibacillus foliorum TaxID=2654974 RepID=A0A972K2P2_9BACL|nr:hypothetical protein [Paenibacillus foliorum]NOU97959.1 hypothetical protein [Paenibacillus foliorum]